MKTRLSPCSELVRNSTSVLMLSEERNCPLNYELMDHRKPLDAVSNEELAPNVEVYYTII